LANKGVFMTQDKSKEEFRPMIYEYSGCQEKVSPKLDNAKEHNTRAEELDKELTARGYDHREVSMMIPEILARESSLLDRIGELEADQARRDVRIGELSDGKDTLKQDISTLRKRVLEVLENHDETAGIRFEQAIAILKEGQ